MDPNDEFDALAASICDEPADPDPDQSGVVVAMDESLLDVEDDEIQVLDPPLLPTPAEPLPASPTTAEHDKVNASNMSVDSRNSGSSNYASSNETGETFCTSYSKYGIREKEKVKIEEKPAPTGDLDEETGRPLLGSAYCGSRTHLFAK